MKYFNKVKFFIIQFMVVFIFFCVVYLPLSYLVGLDIRYDNIIMGVVCSTLVTSTRIMVKKENEKNQEFIKSNYWKLKRELNKKVSENKKRNS